MKAYIPLQEAADLCHLSAKTLRRLIFAGKIEARRIGRKWLVLMEEHNGAWIPVERKPDKQV